MTDQDARDAKVMRLLAHMYPAWRLSCRTDRHGQLWWWAIRDGQSIARTSVDEMSIALSNHALIRHRQRAHL